MTFAQPETAWSDHLQSGGEPGHYAYLLRQGQRLHEALTVLTRAGDLWAFIDSAFRMKVRPTFPSVRVVFDASPHWSVDPDDATLAVLLLEPAVTASLPAGRWVYDLFVDDVPVLAGPFTVQPGASR